MNYLICQNESFYVHTKQLFLLQLIQFNRRQSAILRLLDQKIHQFVCWTFKCIRSL